MLKAAKAPNSLQSDHPLGTTLIEEGQRLDGPLLLIDGWAALVRHTGGGVQQVISLYLPGDMLGLGHSSQDTAYCAVVAMTAVTVEMAPELDGAAAAILARQHEYLMRQAFRTAHKPARERTADLLLELHHRLADDGMTDGDSFHLPLTQTVLASALGMSTVHMNRTLMQLQREGLIARHGEHITLPDIALLSAQVDFRPLQLRPRTA